MDLCQFTDASYIWILLRWKWITPRLVNRLNKSCYLNEPRNASCFCSRPLSMISSFSSKSRIRRRALERRGRRERRESRETRGRRGRRERGGQRGCGCPSGCRGKQQRACARACGSQAWSSQAWAGESHKPWDGGVSVNLGSTVVYSYHNSLSKIFTLRMCFKMRF